MDITGLDMIQISHKMAVYVENSIKGFSLADGDCLFSESYLLYFEEVKNGIPEQYHHRFNSRSKFNGASGFIEVNDMQYIIMLLVDENYTTAYLLSIQLADKKAVIIKDFMN